MQPLSAPFSACFGLAMLFAHPSAPAQPAAPLPLWELGAVGVGVSQQAYPGSDVQVNRGLGLPYLVYRGRFLRADRETAGLRAIKTEHFELDIGVAGSFGARSDQIGSRRGMPDLGTLVQFGPRVRLDLGEGPAGGRWRFCETALKPVAPLRARQCGPIRSGRSVGMRRD